MIYAMSDITPIKSFQPWKINVVETSLQYARDREDRKIALTISLANPTINEWYCLVREQEKVHDVRQDEGELSSFHVPTYLMTFFNYLSLNFSYDCSITGLIEESNVLNIKNTLLTKLLSLIFCTETANVCGSVRFNWV